MGSNVSKTAATITNDIANTVDQSSSASATTTCAIKTGNVILKNSKNSSVTNENKCGASAASALEATVDAAATAYMSATNDQKSSVMPGLNVNSSSQDIKNSIRNAINQKCQANSSTTMEIANGDITIEGCEDTHIKNINFGNAVSNCGVKTVLQAALSAETENASTQESSTLFDNLFGDSLSYIIGGSVLSLSMCCFCCIILIITFALIATS